VTHAACSTNHFNEIPDVWPIGVGAPCVGCTEKSTGFRTPIFQTVDIHAVTPPEHYPLINAPVGSIGTAAAALAGAVVGTVGSAAYMASRKLASSNPPPPPAQETKKEKDTTLVGD